MTGRPAFLASAGPGRSRGPAWCSYVRSTAAAGDLGPDRRRAGPGRAAPGERRAPLRRREALRVGMQPCTPPGEPPPRVRDRAAPSTATTRNRSAAAARVRQPTQVRTGSSIGLRLGRGVLSCRRDADAGRDGRPRVYRVPLISGGSAYGRADRSGHRAALASGRDRARPDRIDSPRRPALTGDGQSGCGPGGSDAPGVAADVDAPAGEPGGEPGVLPLLADRQRELEVRHDHPGRPARRVDAPSPRRPRTATARCRRTWPGRPTSR